MTNNRIALLFLMLALAFGLATYVTMAALIMPAPMGLVQVLH